MTPGTSGKYSTFVSRTFEFSILRHSSKLSLAYKLQHCGIWTAKSEQYGFRSVGICVYIVVWRYMCEPWCCCSEQCHAWLALILLGVRLRCWRRVCMEGMQAQDHKDWPSGSQVNRSPSEKQCKDELGLERWEFKVGSLHGGLNAQLEESMLKINHQMRKVKLDKATEKVSL